jgi:hypothetical protein
MNIGSPPVLLQMVLLRKFSTGLQKANALSLCYYLGTELLGNKVLICSAFIAIVNQFYKMVVTVYTPAISM